MSILSQIAITQAQALASSTLGRFDFFVDSLDDKLKAYDDTNTLVSIGGSNIASGIGYTLTVPTDWDGTPANVQEALDELASRVKGIEDKTDLITVTAAIDLDDVKSKADSALQSGDNVSELVNDAGYTTAQSLSDVLSVGDETGNNNLVLDPGSGPYNFPPTRGAIVVKYPGVPYSVTALYLENDINTGIDVSTGGTNNGVVGIKGTSQVSIRHHSTNNGFTAINTGCSISGFLTMQSSDGFQLQDGANEIIFTANPTSNGLTQTFQDDSGVIALLKNLKASQGNFIKNILDAGTLTATVDDWSPVGFDADTDLIRVDVNANNRQISGIEAPSVGVNRILGINNINAASFDLRFMHNNGLSLAGNRFLLRDNANRAIKPNETAWFWYDHSVQRWKPFNRVG